MKKILIAVAILLPAATFAQNSLQDFFSKYSGKDGFTTVNISPKAMQLVASASSDDETMQMLNDITGLQVLTFENEDGKSADVAQRLTQEAYSAIGKGYDELLSVKEKGTDLKILSSPAEAGIVKDLLIVGEDDGEFVFVNLTGKIDLKKIKNLSSIDVKGLEKLKDADTDDK